MTTTAVTTLKSALDLGNPNQLGDIVAKMKLGSMLTPLKRTFTGLTAAAAFDLTAIDGTGETVGAANANRVAALMLGTLRVTASATAASIGAYTVTDTGGTPALPPTATAYVGASIGLATISDDGKTLTFPNTVTAFIVEYIPRSAVDMTAAQSAFDGAP